MNPTNQSQSQIPEGQVSPQMQQQVAPDVASQQGQQALFQKAVHANVAKKQLDAVMEAVASHLGATTNSRVKNIETASKKIAQKRMQPGRGDYGIEDLNDMLGARLVVKSDKDIPKAKQAIEKLASAGVFDINKQQQVKQGSYNAYHFDVTLSNGTKAELQVHTPQSEAEASVNHSLRSEHGEKPNDPAVTQLKDKQAAIAKSLPNDKAKAVTGAIQQMMQQQGGQVAPQQSAQLLAQAQQ
jgi:ppGpp synthetase/RelA/SpoT-type nucleotidyltranferase